MEFWKIRELSTTSPLRCPQVGTTETLKHIGQQNNSHSEVSR
jgi:hypothetical protein